MPFDFTLRVLLITLAVKFFVMLLGLIDFISPKNLYKIQFFLVGSMKPQIVFVGKGVGAIILEIMVPKGVLVSLICWHMHTIQYWHPFIDKHVTFTKIPHSLYPNELNDLSTMKMFPKGDGGRRLKINLKNNPFDCFLVLPSNMCREPNDFQSPRRPKTSQTISTLDKGLNWTDKRDAGKGAARIG